jgi:excinuclease ABC subunit B
MYADTVTGSMQRAIDETARRRRIQAQFNLEHSIVPIGIKKAVKDITERVAATAVAEKKAAYAGKPLDKSEVIRLIKDLESQMRQAAKQMEFEEAALIRDRIIELRKDFRE